MNIGNYISLQEVLIKTSYQTQTTLPTDKLLENPIAFGSGFIVEYHGEKFFVTADHNLNPDDYDENVIERTGNENVISVFTNYTPPENFLSTVLVPLGGFYYMDQFDLDKPGDISEPVDIALCKMKSRHLQYPFLCDDIKFAKQGKLSIREECFGLPQQGKNYYILGNINTKIEEHIRLDRKKILQENLKFRSEAGDYFLFNTPALITDKKDWEGLSGSPVISEDGDCIGVLSSVNENSTSIWVMPIAKVKLLLDIAILQEAE